MKKMWQIKQLKHHLCQYNKFITMGSLCMNFLESLGGNTKIESENNRNSNDNK